MGVLGETSVAGLAIASQPFDAEKRMLDGGANRTLAAVTLSLRLGQRCVAPRSHIGEVFGVWGATSLRVSACAA